MRHRSWDQELVEENVFCQAIIFGVLFLFMCHVIGTIEEKLGVTL